VVKIIQENILPHQCYKTLIDFLPFVVQDSGNTICIFEILIYKYFKNLYFVLIFFFLTRFIVLGQTSG